MKTKFLIIKKILSLLGLFLVLAFFTNTTGTVGCGGSGVDVELVDGDGDGSSVPQSLLDDDDWEYGDDDLEEGYDCDDDDATINPEATETAGDGIDQDCDGLDVDADIECTGSTLDCDGDYVTDSCDNDPYSAEDDTILTGEDGCDVETVDGEYYVGDGYMDISCNTYESSYGYTVSSDGLYDSSGTYIGPRTLCDNCPTTANSDQTDSNGDGEGDACEAPDACEVDADEDKACDTDVDEDGTVDDNCVDTYNPYVTDSDGDGTLDTQTDTDSDGSGDECDSFTDADEDGYSTQGDESGENIDCDDDDATVYPESTEAEDLLGDGVDQDCDGSDTPDESEILYVYTGFSGEQTDDDGDYDGKSPNRPLHSIDEALNNSGSGSGITYIFVYAGGSANSDDEDLEIDEEVTIIGGFKCYTTNDNGEEEELNIYSDTDRAECTETSQVKRTVASDPTEIDVNNLTILTTNDEGPTVTITDNATLEGFYIAASEDAEDETDDLSTTKVAIYIDNAAPTIKNSFIVAPTKHPSDAENSIKTIAVYIDNSSESDPVTLSGNYIMADHEDNEDDEEGGYSTYVYAVYSTGALIANRNRVAAFNDNQYATGFFMQTEEGAQFYNNIIEAQGIGIYFFFTDDAEVINNTFYISTSGLMTEAALYFDDSSSPIITNNIFDSEEDTTTIHAIYSTLVSSVDKLPVELRNNLFSYSLFAYVGYADGASVKSASDEDLELKLDSTSTVSGNIEDDDGDLELDNDSYTPDDNSLAVNAGYTSIGTDDIGESDYDGEDRIYGSIDIGAQENQTEDEEPAGSGGVTSGKFGGGTGTGPFTSGTWTPRSGGGRFGGP